MGRCCLNSNYKNPQKMNIGLSESSHPLRVTTKVTDIWVAKKSKQIQKAKHKLKESFPGAQPIVRKAQLQSGQLAQLRKKNLKIKRELEKTDTIISVISHLERRIEEKWRGEREERKTVRERRVKEEKLIYFNIIIPNVSPSYLRIQM